MFQFAMQNQIKMNSKIRIILVISLSIICATVSSEIESKTIDEKFQDFLNSLGPYQIPVYYKQNLISDDK